MKAEYANLLPLAMANGTFEANPEKVWSKVYSYNRREISPEQVAAMMDELERVRMVFRWKDPSGKQWGYFIGIDKPGRLPPASRIRGAHELRGPEPPMLMIQQFIKEGGTDGQPMAIQDVLGGYIGFGVGSGLGVGIGSGSGGNKPFPINHQETTVTVMQETHLSGSHIANGIEQQLITFSVGTPLRVASERMIAAINRYKELGGTKIHFWLSEGGWLRDESTWEIPGRTGSKQQERSRHNIESLLRASAAIDAAAVIPDSGQREGGTGRAPEPRVLEGVRKATSSGN